jgi:hypothetical protein
VTVLPFPEQVPGQRAPDWDWDRSCLHHSGVSGMLRIRWRPVVVTSPRLGWREYFAPRQGHGKEGTNRPFDSRKRDDHVGHTVHRLRTSARGKQIPKRQGSDLVASAIASAGAACEGVRSPMRKSLSAAGFFFLVASVGGQCHSAERLLWHCDRTMFEPSGQAIPLTSLRLPNVLLSCGHAQLPR